jgi:medium-chain acyl-[acyl-carrier-protein] hydrolase
VAHRKAAPSASLRLFCFPHSGAEASVFVPWADALPAGVELCPVQLPGHGSRLAEPLHARMEPLVREAATGLAPLMDRPFALFGHSLGGLIAFELARRLREIGAHQPAALFISGTGAPQLRPDWERIHDLPEPEFVVKLRALKGTPEGVLANPELRELVLPILRADFSVYETYAYRPGEPLECPLTAFGGLEDPHVTRESLAAWKEQTTGPFAVRMVPGDHFFLVTRRAELLASLAPELNSLARGRGASW